MGDDGVKTTIPTCDRKLSSLAATPRINGQDLLRGSGKARVAETRKISVVDDDDSVREALRSLLKSVGFEVEVFASAEEFLNSSQLLETECLILDVRMPGMSGIELQDQLATSHGGLPVVFISAHADAEARERALENGAVGFL